MSKWEEDILERLDSISDRVSKLEANISTEEFIIATAVEYTDEVFEWLARDEDGRWWAYNSEPSCDGDQWMAKDRWTDIDTLHGIKDGLSWKESKRKIR